MAQLLSWPCRACPSPCTPCPYTDTNTVGLATILRRNVRNAHLLLQLIVRRCIFRQSICMSMFCIEITTCVVCTRGSSRFSRVDGSLSSILSLWFGLSIDQRNIGALVTSCMFIKDKRLAHSKLTLGFGFLMRRLTSDSILQ